MSFHQSVSGCWFCVVQRFDTRSWAPDTEKEFQPAHAVGLPPLRSSLFIPVLACARVIESLRDLTDGTGRNCGVTEMCIFDGGIRHYLRVQFNVIINHAFG